MAPSSRFVRAAMAVAACLAPQAAGYTLSLTPRTRCSTTLARPNLRTPLVVAAASDVRSADEEACLVLPHEDYPGQAPETIMGEMSLKEMEDDQETYSQIYLLEDGSVTLGASDGPPAEKACGLWQCGSEGFQMTLTRTFLS